jgi:hypothetical protein
LKCPYCEEELGLNYICINPTCSHFGNTINFPEKSKINNTQNSFDNENSNVTEISNLNTSYNYINSDYYSKNKAANAYFNLYSSNDNISREEFAAFIGDHNTNYYLEYIHKMKDNNKFPSWNWSCFFLSHYWLLYRKLYIPATLVIFLTLVSSRLFEIKTHLFFILIMRIILTIFANAIYLNNCEHKIKAIKPIIAALNTTQYINRLRSKGGVNLVAPIVLLIIYILGSLIYITMWFISLANSPHEFSSPSYYF